ncbi:MAG TPA: 2-oxoglutarate and iron-dependent oxygenase domain-containing protein [Polyangiales bacterium]|nr:2-oxoglutarate and iron-dependent oxygenase domain-containing protein [Polyangiales bacterium]
MVELVPTIDLSSWHGDSSERTAIAAQVDAACSRVGFMQIVGHGLPDDVVNTMLRATDALFALPLADKLALLPPHPGVNRGYAPRAAESLAYSQGAEKALPDLFEAFNIGLDVVPDEPFYRDAPHEFFAPNLWPAALPSLRPALTTYFDHAVGLASTLTDVFALALRLPERWFRPYVDRSTLTMRVNHYEGRDGDTVPEPGQMRMGAHTDYGVVTVLYADPVPGLQILGPDARFHDVVPRPGALLVNLGDMTALWTNDRWRSTLHRVVPPSAASGASRRRSVALFLDANCDARIACLPTCATAEQPAKYPPVLAGDHLIEKILGPRLGRASGGVHTARDRVNRQG